MSRGGATAKVLGDEKDDGEEARRNEEDRTTFATATASLPSAPSVSRSRANTERVAPAASSSLKPESRTGASKRISSERSAAVACGRARWERTAVAGGEFFAEGASGDDAAAAVVIFLACCPLLACCFLESTCSLWK